MRMGTPDYFVLFQPFGRMGTQETERSHGLLGVKDVVYDTLKVIPTKPNVTYIIISARKLVRDLRVIGVRHDIFAVGGSELEGMCKFIGFITAQ